MCIFVSVELDNMVYKIFLFIFVFACLFLFREAFMLCKAIIKGEKNLTSWRVLGIGLSLAYIITILISGFGL